MEVEVEVELKVTLKEEVESLSDITEINIDDSFLSRVSESLIIEKGIDVLPKDSSIYENFIYDLFAEVDGSNLLIEDNRDGKFELILNAHQITSDEESLIKKTLSKVSNYKSVYFFEKFKDYSFNSFF